MVNRRMFRPGFAEPKEAIAPRPLSTAFPAHGQNPNIPICTGCGSPPGP